MFGGSRQGKRGRGGCRQDHRLGDPPAEQEGKSLSHSCAEREEGDLPGAIAHQAGQSRLH